MLALPADSSHADVAPTPVCCLEHPPDLPYSGTFGENLPISPTSLRFHGKHLWREKPSAQKASGGGKKRPFKRSFVRNRSGLEVPGALGVLLHVVQVGGHDEMFGVKQTVLVCVHLPPGVVALVGDVAFTAPRLELPEVQPGLVVLRSHTHTHTGAPKCSAFIRFSRSYSLLLKTSAT